MMMEDATHGRDIIAQLAEIDGEIVFARQVRAGCWDHRRDVSAAIADPSAFEAMLKAQQEGKA